MKTISTLQGIDTTNMDGSFPLPSQILEQLESLQLPDMPEPEFAKGEPISPTIRISGNTLKASRLVFGPGQTPENLRQRIHEAQVDFIGEKMEAYGVEATPEEIEAVRYSVTLEMQRIRKWVDEQRKARNPRINRYPTKKEDGLWKSAWVSELPPFAKNHQEAVWDIKDGKRRKIELPPSPLTHQPAFYFFRHPSGWFINLGQAKDGWQPIKHTNPTQALQSIISRRGIENRPKGGDVECLNFLLGKSKTDSGDWPILPSYMTIWNGKSWVVIVGYKKNPKVTLSTYKESEDDLKITNEVEDEGRAMTVSEAEWAILKQTMPIHDRDGGTLNLDWDELAELPDGSTEFSINDLDETGMVVMEAADLLGRKHEFLQGEQIWEHPEFNNALRALKKEAIEDYRDTKKVIAMLDKAIDHFMILRARSIGVEKEEWNDRIKSSLEHRNYINYRMRKAMPERFDLINSVHEWVNERANPPHTGRKPWPKDRDFFPYPWNQGPWMHCPEQNIQDTLHTFTDVSEMPEHKGKTYPKGKDIKLRKVFKGFVNAFSSTNGTWELRFVPKPAPKPIAGFKDAPKRLQKAIRGMMPKKHRKPVETIVEGKHYFHFA